MTDNDISTLIDRRVADAAALFNEKLGARDTAMALQAVEYERRLKALNGEHTTLAAMRDTYVLREVYSKDLERLYTERDQSRSAAEEARVQSAGAALAATRNTMLAAMGMIVALVGWAITLLLHFLPGAA